MRSQDRTTDEPAAKTLATGSFCASDEECIQAAKLVNAHSFIKRLPQGYQTQITADGTNLSQGQRQLLAITRTAIADPPVMILDEATSSIDTRTERLIEKGMDALMEDRTVFVIAHRLSTVRNARAILVWRMAKSSSAATTQIYSKRKAVTISSISVSMSLPETNWGTLS